MDKISLKQFMEENEGIRVPVPWDAPRLTGQCVSLVQQYLLQCLDQPAQARGNAKEWAWTYPNEGLGEVTNTPQYGDIVVFDNGGTYGHIAIYLADNEVFEQNVSSHGNYSAGVGPFMPSSYKRTFLRPYASLIDDSEHLSKETMPLIGKVDLYDINGNEYDIASTITKTVEVLGEVEINGESYTKVSHKNFNPNVVYIKNVNNKYIDLIGTVELYNSEGEKYEIPSTISKTVEIIGETIIDNEKYYKIYYQGFNPNEVYIKA